MFETKGWREQATEWEQVRKPNSVRAHREIQAIDPEQLSDEDLLQLRLQPARRVRA